MKKEFYKRGAIFWVDLPWQNGSVQHGNKPCCIVSNNKGNYNSSIVMVIPCTSKDKPFLPTHFEVNYKEISGTFMCEQVRTIDQSQLGHFIKMLEFDELFMLDKCLANSFDLVGKYDKIETKEEIENKRFDKTAAKMILEELIACKKSFDDKTTILRKMLEEYTPAIGKMSLFTNTELKIPAIKSQGKKRIYTKRTLETIKEFVKEWGKGDAETRKQLLVDYEFSSYANAVNFYYRWHNKVKV